MGKRIIIIDNRQKRAQGLMKDQWESFLNLQPDLFYVDSISDPDLSAFDVIAVHGSYITEHNYEDLFLRYAQNKYVIVFSGGITQVNFISEGHLLKIPAVRFYSSHLIPFCTYVLNQESEEEVNLSMLVYGVDHWRIPQLIKLRDILWRYPDDDSRPSQVDREKTRLMANLSLTNLDTLTTAINNELLSL